MLTFYGFAKLNGSQFTVLSSELDKPLGDVSGFWLTWRYFGYSPVFGTLIALAQIGLAVLLCWRKSALPAACAGLGIMLTITLIDLTYAIDLGGSVMALFTAACLGFIVFTHRAELVRVLWTERPAGDTTSRRRIAVKVAAQAAVLAVAFAGTYWLANDNNRAPTPLDGAWQVEAGTYQPTGTADPLDRLYFEYNRARLVVFRCREQWIWHDFEVDSDRKELRIRQVWLRKDTPLLFRGTYTLTGDRLTIQGTTDSSPAPVQLSLTRIPNR
ncbi:hypothetical protein ABZ345_27905 [Lentzea sp. NPDC005914]|uniref:hypothetical protein n=1 Tax=Lentzea sp. NPDC005914 TaxID=3154572 RepID=UPI0033BFD226